MSFSPPPPPPPPPKKKSLSLLQNSSAHDATCNSYPVWVNIVLHSSTQEVNGGLETVVKGSWVGVFWRQAIAANTIQHNTDV